MLSLSSANSQVSDGGWTAGVPMPFRGVWERADRYVMFAEGDDFLSSRVTEKTDTFVSIMLKTFYGWYLDRTAEPASFEGLDRTLNDSTCPKPEYIRIEYRPLVTSSVSSDGSVWELFIWYPGLKEASVVPAAVIGGEIYLDFAVKLAVAKGGNTPDSGNGGQEAVSDPLAGFWCRMAEADGIKVCPPCSKTDIYSTYITKDAVYTIRYWLTDMEYTNENAFFSDGGNNFSVVKHIQSAGKVYTCAQGRRVAIRNVRKTNDRTAVYRLDSGATICGLGKPYLKRVQEENSAEAVFALAKKYYETRAPNPNPPFPPSNLDWNMETINRLESGNEIIQKVRERQKEFAIKAKKR